VDQTISDAIRRSGTNATITLLGDIEHSNKGRRKLFMIRSDVLAIDASRSPEVVEIIRVAGSKIRLPFSLVARSKLRKFKKILSAYTLSA
jgi:hypothetical protein